MKRQHKYSSNIQWTGNNGEGTLNDDTFERSYTISIENKPDILGSSDPSFRGDETKHNPEELLIASIATCHMLWYLHLCSEAGIVVVNYVDYATGTMVETSGGGGYFTEVVLNPVVEVSKSSMTEKANELHKKANEMCFISNSLNFKVLHQPTSICS